MIEKAVIMAAGKGTRMLPLTEKIPKQLIEINGKPFLFYLLDSLRKAGYNKLAIIASHKIEKVRKYIASSGFDVAVIDQGDSEGTAYAIRAAEKFVDGDHFIVLGGDNLWSVNDLSRINKKDDFNYVAGYKVNDPSKYGVLVEDDGKLIKIHEKPRTFVGNFISTGLYKFTPEVFDAIRGIDISPRGEYELVDAISILANEGRVKVLKLEDFWLDLGCLEDIPKVSEFLKENSIG